MMQEVRPTVRPASLADVPSLVELRLANAVAHLALDPDTYRVPQHEVVVRQFTAMLADGPGRALFSSLRLTMAGWSGWLRLLEAAERWATDRGITYLSAGIYHRNVDAVRFYGRHGYTDAGLSLGRHLD